jgi:hypothetical protein
MSPTTRAAGAVVASADGRKVVCAALCAVLGNQALLAHIFSRGVWSAAHLASAAMVCRQWARIAGADELWYSVWWRSAPSMRHMKARVAASTGFRGAVAQLRASALLARAHERATAGGGGCPPRDEK